MSIRIQSSGTPVGPTRLDRARITLRRVLSGRISQSFFRDRRLTGDANYHSVRRAPDISPEYRRTSPRCALSKLWSRSVVWYAGALGSALLGAVVCAMPAVSGEASRTLKIGILTTAWSPWHSNTTGFRDALEELGYEDGRNVVFEVRAAKGDPTRLLDLAAELIQQKPDLLYCVAAPDALACQKATSTIPIVFTQVSDPVAVGLVESLARPGKNVTGIASLRAELTAKRLELFKEALPSLHRVLVTFDPREPEEREALKFARLAAGKLGLELFEHPIMDRLEMEPALAKLEAGGRDGILIIQSGLNLNIPGRTLEVAISNGLPTMYPSSFWTQYGALLSYGPDQYLQGQQAARLAHRILTGTPARDLPVEQPDRIEFIINLKTAEKIGLQIPQTTLLRVDRIIE